MNTNMKLRGCGVGADEQWIGAGADAQCIEPRPAWDMEEMARRSCLDMLMSRFGIDAALVSAPQLAKALGMSKSTIYASIKEGRFFIPHRMVGRSPVFTVDDVVAWYRFGDVESKQEAALAAQNGGAVVISNIVSSEPADFRLSALQEKQRRDRTVDLWVAKATGATIK